MDSFSSIKSEEEVIPSRANFISNALSDCDTVIDFSPREKCIALSEAGTWQQESEALKILNNSFCDTSDHPSLFELFLEYDLFGKIISCVTSDVPVVSSRAIDCLVNFTRTLYFAQLFIENGLFGILGGFLESDDLELVLDAATIFSYIIPLADLYCKRALMILNEDLAKSLIDRKNPAVTDKVTKLIGYILNSIKQPTRQEKVKILGLVAHLLKAWDEVVVDNLLFGLAGFIKSDGFSSDLPEMATILYCMEEFTKVEICPTHLRVLEVVGRLYQRHIACVECDWIITAAQCDIPEVKSMAFWTLSVGLNQKFISIDALKQFTIGLCTREERDEFQVEFELVNFILNVLIKASEEILHEFIDIDVMTHITDFLECSMDDAFMLKKVLEIMLRTLQCTRDSEDYEHVIEVYSDELVMSNLHEIADGDHNEHCRDRAVKLISELTVVN